MLEDRTAAPARCGGRPGGGHMSATVHLDLPLGIAGTLARQVRTVPLGDLSDGELRYLLTVTTATHQELEQFRQAFRELLANGLVGGTLARAYGPALAASAGLAEELTQAADGLGEDPTRSKLASAVADAFRG